MDQSSSLPEIGYSVENNPENNAKVVLSAKNMLNIMHVGQLKGHTNGIMSLAFHPHKSWIATGGHDQSVRVWDIKSQQELFSLEGHHTPVTGLQFHPEKPLLISVSGNFGTYCEVRFWDMDTRQEKENLRIKIGPTFRPGAEISPDGMLLIVNSRLYRVDDGSLIISLGSHRAGVNQPAFNHDGSLIALAVGTDTGYSGQVDNAVKVYETQSGELVREFRQHQGWVYTTAFSSPQSVWGELILGVDHFGFLYGWDIRTNELIAGGDGITALAFAPSGDLLVVANRDMTLRLLDVSTGGDGHKLHGHTDRIHAVAFNKESTLMASAGDDHCVYLWAVDDNIS